MDAGRFRAQYGPWGLVAGASQGLGAAFAAQLAGQGLDLVLIARRETELARLGQRLARDHGVAVRQLALDLGSADALDAVRSETADLEIGLLVCNAALSLIGPFLDEPVEGHLAELDLNCRVPLTLAHHFGRAMQRRGRGGIVLMSSLAGAQGSPNIATYAATKAFGRVLAEGLWGELRGDGVAVLACCAGATRTPGYLAGRPDDRGSALVPEMEPEAVVREALAALGRLPSMIPGRGNRIASFFLQHLLPRRTAIELMGRSTRGRGSRRRE